MTQKGPKTYDLYIGYVPLDWNESDVREKFSKYGQIHSILLKMSDKEDNMQYGFVRYLNEQESEQALKNLHGMNTGSTRLKVSRGKRGPKPGESFSPQYKENKSPLSSAWLRSEDTTHTSTFNSSNATYTNGSTDTPKTKNLFKKETPPKPLINGPSTLTAAPIKIEPVLVTEVSDAVHFWAQTLTPPETEKITQLSSDLQVYCNEQQPQKFTLYAGKTYATQYTLDNMWYRCQLLESLPNDQFKVQFIDYGNTEVKAAGDFCELSPELAQLSPGAKLYGLAGYEVVSFYEVQRASAKELMTNLTANKIMEAAIFTDSSPISVELREGQLDVGMEMEKAGFVKKKKKKEPVQQSPVSGFKAKEVKVNSEKSPPRSDASETSKLQEEVKYLQKQVEVLRARLASQAAQAIQPEEVQKLKAANEEMKKVIEEQKEVITILNGNNLVYQQNEDRLADKVKHSMKYLVENLVQNIQEMNKARFGHAIGESSTPKFLETAIELIQDRDSKIELTNIAVLEEVLNANKVLDSTQAAIRSTLSKESLPDLTAARNTARKDLHEQISKLLEQISAMPLARRKANLKEIVNVLQSLGQSSRDADESESMTLTLDEAVVSYHGCVEAQASTIKALQNTTDQCSITILEALESLKKALVFPQECDLDSLTGACALNSLVEEYANAVKLETQQAKSTDGLQTQKLAHHLVSLLTTTIKKELEDINYLQYVANIKYGGAKDNLEKWLSTEPDVSELVNIRKTLKGLKSKFRHKQADRRDLEENAEDSDSGQDLNKVEEELKVLRDELHAAFVQEHLLLTQLANISKDHFPELPIMHSDLKIADHLETNGLVKVGHELEHYSHHVLPSLPCTGKHLCLKSVFNGTPCILKEYPLDSGSSQQIQERAVAFSKICHKSLIQLEALFVDKPNRKAYIQLPYVEQGNLLDWKSNKSVSQVKEVLKGVLLGLHALHSAGLIHGAVYAENVLVCENGECCNGILADFDFSQNEENRAANTKERLEFACSDAISSAFDMQCFGQLVYQSLVSSPLVSSDPQALSVAEDPQLTSLLSGLLHQNADQRLTASQALEQPFFKTP